MSLESNIWKIQLYKLTAGIIKWWSAVIIIFYLNNGLSFSQIGILFGIVAATAVVMEIPTGMIADKFGRKLSLILAQTSIVIASLIFLLFGGFIPLIVASLFYGLQKAFESGADTALIYDTLKELKKEEEFKKVNGRTFAIYHLGFAISIPFVGFIAKVSFAYVFALSIMIGVLGLFALFAVKEPKVHKGVANEGYFKTFKESFLHALKVKRLFYLILFSAIFVSYANTIFKFNQGYFQAIGLPLEYFGIMWFGATLISSISSWHMHKIEKKLGEKLSLIIMPIGISAIYIFMGLYPSILGAIVQFFTSPFSSLQKVATEDYMNNHIESKNRATVLSIGSFITEVLAIFVGLLIGYFSDIYGAVATHWITGAIFAGAMLIPTINLVRHKHQ